MSGVRGSEGGEGPFGVGDDGGGGEGRGIV